MKKIKCLTCEYLNYDAIADEYEYNLPYFCGLHGRGAVDPYGEQIDFDHHGGCGYSEKNQNYQLQLEFDF